MKMVAALIFNRSTRRSARLRDMELLSYNIQYTRGKDDRYDTDRIVSEIQGADLIALQEVECWARRSGFTHQAEEIARRMPGYYWVYGAGIDVDASEMVDGQLVNRRNQFGNMVLSRWPILSSVNHTLPKMALRNAFHLQRTLVETVIDADGMPLRFCSVHFDHVDAQTRLPQVDYAIDLLLNAESRGASWGGPTKGPWFEQPEPPMPTSAVLMGDFNFTYESEEYRRFLGNHNPMHGRLSRMGGFVDAWTESGHDVEEGTTIVSQQTGEGKRIDHCFVTTDLAPAVESMSIDHEAVGSDHQPIRVVLNKTP